MYVQINNKINAKTRETNPSDEYLFFFYKVPGSSCNSKNSMILYIQYCIKVVCNNFPIVAEDRGLPDQHPRMFAYDTPNTTDFLISLISLVSPHPQLLDVESAHTVGL